MWPTTLIFRGLWPTAPEPAAAAVTLAAMGPGEFSVDRLLGIDEKLGPAQRAALAAGLGLGAAALQLAVFWRPKRSETEPEAGDSTAA